MTQSYRIRSFVGRNSRITTTQSQALTRLWPRFGLSLNHLVTDETMGRCVPRYLEIGFGSGQSLLQAATLYPQYDFIGVETHQPGIGALLLGLEKMQLTNVKVFAADVIDVLTLAIPDASLAGVQIFFPDPWPKRKHVVRRLVQAAFITQIVQKLKPEASLHLATDWEDYARQMQTVLTNESQLINEYGVQHFAGRSPFRPITTKFEARALREGRQIWELQFKKSC